MPQGAGGASMSTRAYMFAVGKRNFFMLRKVLWKESLMIKNQGVGGTISRMLYLDLDSGRTWIVSKGKEWDL